MVDAGTDGLTQMFADVLSVNPSAVLLLLAIVISLGLAIGVTAKTKNKTLGIATFFMCMGFFAFINWINWLIIIIPLILLSGYFFFAGGKDNK